MRARITTKSSALPDRAACNHCDRGRVNGESRIGGQKWSRSIQITSGEIRIHADVAEK